MIRQVQAMHSKQLGKRRQGMQRTHSGGRLAATALRALITGTVVAGALTASAMAEDKGAANTPIGGKFKT